jgi:hypothetical protein
MIRKLHPSFLLRSFANRIISSRRIIRIIYRILGYRPLAYLLFLSVDKGEWTKSKPSVLCIKRNLFDKDIKELRRHAENLNWLTIGTPQLAYIQSSWMPKILRRQTMFQKYFTEDYKKVWEESELFAKRFLKLVISRLNVKVILSANIDYWQDESLRRGGKVLGIPFLALSKENCTNPGVFSRVLKYYQGANFKFDGDGIAVFSQEMKKVLAESGVCKPEAIYVTGAPRLDAWKNIKHTQDFQDTIMLLPYGKDFGIKYDTNFADVLDVILSYAKKHYNANLNFVIKCKNEKHRSDLTKKLTKEDLKYINLVAGQPLFKLFPRSRLVIGYNSLALAEALLSKAVIVIPQWGEIGKDYQSQQFNPKDETCSSVIEFVESIQDLEKLLEKVMENQSYSIDIKKRLKLMQNYMFYDQNKFNSKYVEEFVLSFLH